MAPQVTISERVYEHREWEVHHRRWAMQHYEDILRDLGNPTLVAFHGGMDAHLIRMRKAMQDIKDQFDARYARGRTMTAEQLRNDR